MSGRGLQWSPIDHERVMLAFNYREQELTYIISFDACWAVTQLAARRYIGEEGPENWIGRVSNYRELNGIRIPMTIEAV